MSLSIDRSTRAQHRLGEHEEKERPAERTEQTAPKDEDRYTTEPMEAFRFPFLRGAGTSGGGRPGPTQPVQPHIPPNEGPVWTPYHVPPFEHSPLAPTPNVAPVTPPWLPDFSPQEIQLRRYERIRA